MWPERRLRRRAAAGALAAAVGALAWAAGRNGAAGPIVPFDPPVSAFVPASAGSVVPSDSALVWIFLDSASAASNAPPALSRAALERRLRSGSPVLPGDRPIPPRLVAMLEDAGARVRVRSRWLRAVSARVAVADLDRVRSVPGVRGLRPVGRLRHAGLVPVGSPGRFVSRGAGAAAVYGAGCPLADQAPELTPASYGGLYSALRQMHVPGVHELGITGRGVTIAILDTGFEPGHESLSPLRVLAARDFIHGDAVVSDQAGDTVEPQDPEEHGTWVWSILAGCAPGRLVGPAFGSDFLLAKVEDANADVPANEDRWVQAVEWADSLGADVVNSSLAYRFFDTGESYAFSQLDGDQLPSTVEADEAARRGVLVITAIGNNGPQPGTLMAPADADSVVAVGAVDSLGSPLFASSRGPTADGRVKPELTARGIGVPAASYAAPDAYRAGLSGTSIATPLVAGGAALFIEAWPDLSPMAARRALLLSGSNASDPDINVGWGVPDVLSAITFPEGVTPLSVQGAGADGAFTTLTPTFRWSVPLLHPSARPVRYYLELATDSAFADVAYRDSVGDAQALSLRRPVRPAPRLLWRVVAVASNGATRVSRVAGVVSMPPWVTLRAPNGSSGDYVGTARPTFTWSALPASSPVGPLSFDVEVFAATGRQVVASVASVTDTTVTLQTPLSYNVPYRWRVVARSPLGAADTVESVSPFVVVSQERPPSTQLYQNFPNPFPNAASSTTHFWFDVSEASDVVLAVFDLRGRLVRRLIPAPGCGPVHLDPGLYGRGVNDEPDPCISTEWNGRDDAGRKMPAGVYIGRLRAAGVERFVRILFRPS